MSEDELKLALKHATRDERHLSNAETRYWCDQYKLLATQAIEALAQPEHGWTPEQLAGMARLKEAQDKKLSQRTWVGLTPQERDEINEQVYGAVPHHVAFHAAIEAKLKEKNT
jgi:hypothetical protein